MKHISLCTVHIEGKTIKDSITIEVGDVPNEKPIFVTDKEWLAMEEPLPDNAVLIETNTIRDKDNEVDYKECAEKYDLLDKADESMFNAEREIKEKLSNGEIDHIEAWNLLKPYVEKWRSALAEAPFATPPQSDIDRQERIFKEYHQGVKKE
jgi:hypothetical protein